MGVVGVGTHHQASYLAFWQGNKGRWSSHIFKKAFLGEIQAKQKRYTRLGLVFLWYSHTVLLLQTPCRTAFQAVCQHPARVPVLWRQRLAQTWHMKLELSNAVNLPRFASAVPWIYLARRIGPEGVLSDCKLVCDSKNWLTLFV